MRRDLVGLAAAVPLGGPRDRDQVDLEPVGGLHERLLRRVALSPLDPADVRAVQLAAETELLLGEIARDAVLADRTPERGKRGVAGGHRGTVTRRSLCVYGL